MQRTLVLIKPDAVKRGLVGEVITRLERRCYEIVQIKTVQVDKEFAEAHYEEHKGKNFFDPLCEFLASSRLVALIVEGTRAITGVREVIGQYGTPGSIRGDLANVNVIRENIIHASDTEENAKKEITLWFGEDDVKLGKRARD